MKKRKTTQAPNISVNKLGEFIMAKPERQRTIVKQFKYPDENKFGFANSHNDAKYAIKQYLINDFDIEFIDEGIERLEGKTDLTEHAEKVNNSALEGLRIVSNFGNFPVGIEFMDYEYENPIININGVDVKVTPDILVKSTVRGKEYFGLLKIHSSKNAKLTIEASEYVAAVLHKFAVFNLTESIKPSNCISFDVFAENFITCPQSVIRRTRDIEAACLTYRNIWDSI